MIKIEAKMIIISCIIPDLIDAGYLYPHNYYLAKEVEIKMR